MLEPARKICRTPSDIVLSSVNTSSSANVARKKINANLGCQLRASACARAGCQIGGLVLPALIPSVRHRTAPSATQVAPSRSTLYSDIELTCTPSTLAYKTAVET